MNNYNNEMTFGRTGEKASTVFISKVFNWMGIGLAITGVIAMLAADSGLALQIASSPLYYVLFIAELGLVFFLSARVSKVKAATATALFIIYAALNGLTMSVIFLIYTQASIASTFFITAAMFGATAFYGFVTKKDLTSMGSFLFMGVIGIVIASVVNMFLKSSALYWMISFVGVIVFVGLTAYDMQKIKRMGEQGIMSQGNEIVQKGAIMGALALYLDFINLFLMMLRFMGGSRD